MRLRRSTECWLESGLVTVIGAPGVPRRSRLRRRSSSGTGKRVDVVGRDEGGRDDFAEPRPGERLADRIAHLERRGAVGGHRRVRAGCRGSARSRGRGRPPRQRRPRWRGRAASVGTMARSVSVASASGRRAAAARRRRGSDEPPGASRRLDADARPAASTCSACRNIGAQQAIDARRPERDAGALGSTGFVSTRPAARPCHRPTRATSWAVRSAPIRASRISWPFSNRRLASDRRAYRWAVRRIADRIEDRGLHDHVASSRR